MASSSQSVTLWLFKIAMENGSFTDDFPSYKTFIDNGFSIAMLNNQMVYILIMRYPLGMTHIAN